ncbi:hypothetical protein LPJ79_000372 [Coemansia sp. RSA 1821]|nr:hypothetical protein LPJ79_000372 [Coemansia sp. RSA 1821]
MHNFWSLRNELHARHQNNTPLSNTSQQNHKAASRNKYIAAGGTCADMSLTPTSITAHFIPNYLDIVMQQERLLFAVKLHRTHELLPYLKGQFTLYIPDFMLAKPPEFRRELFKINPPLELRSMLGSQKPVVCQAIFVVLRPQLALPIREKIIHVCQSKALDKYKRFSKLGDVQFDPKATAIVDGTLKFSDPESEFDVTYRGFDVGFTNSADDIKPFVICGPRHLGKSHVMLHVAALMTCDPGVVVIYIGDCRELCLSDKDNDISKYVRFIEHMVCSFRNYAFITTLADKWYANTNMGTNWHKMQSETSNFMLKVSDHCQQNEITVVYFLDHCEEYLDANPFDTVVYMRDLERIYGGVVVLNLSDCKHYRSCGFSMSYQCTISGVLNPVEAKSMCINSIKRLHITDTELETMLASTQYHPLDTVSVMQKFENYLADIGSSEEDAQHHRNKALGYAIADQEQSRRARVAQMHVRFVEDMIAKGTLEQGAKHIQRVGMCQRDIDTSTPEIHEIKREIMQCAFALYHDIELKPGSLRDIQFIVHQSPNDREHGSQRARDKSTSSRNNPLCLPPIAREIMYNVHFRGTVEEQFGWLFSSKNRFDVDESIRLRYFDNLLLESGKIHGLACNLRQEKCDFSLSFDFIRGKSDGVELGPVEPRECRTFEEAIDVLNHYIEVSKKLGPEYLPRGSESRLESSIMLYFPNLAFTEEWMDSSIREATHFHGSFMAAVTRIDLFDSAARGDSKEYKGKGCQFNVTWISSDPIYISASREAQERQQLQLQQMHAMSIKKDQADEPMDIEEVPRDITDNDLKYGSERSWTAKAIRLFPHIQKKTKELDTVDKVGLLAVTASQRCSSLVENKGQKIKKLVSQKEYGDIADCVGIMASKSAGAFGKRVEQHV